MFPKSTFLNLELDPGNLNLKMTIIRTTHPLYLTVVPSNYSQESHGLSVHDYTSLLKKA